MAEVIKRWTAARKKDAVMRMMKGEPVDEVSRDLGVETYRLEKWKDQALAFIEVGLKDRQGDPLAEELDKAKKQIGQQAMEIELLRDLSTPVDPESLIGLWQDAILDHDESLPTELVNRLNASLEAILRKYHLLEARVDKQTFLNKIAELRQDMDAKENEIANLRSEKDSEIASLKSEIRDGKQALGNLSTQLATAKQNVRDLQNDVSERNDTIDNLQVQVREGKQDIDDLTDQLDDERTARQQTEEDIAMIKMGLLMAACGAGGWYLGGYAAAKLGGYVLLGIGAGSGAYASKKIAGGDNDAMYNRAYGGLARHGQGLLRRA